MNEENLKAGQVQSRDLTDEQFAELAREYYLEDFPNPQRIDCPQPTVLKNLASSDDLPDEKLHRHLLACSPCLENFRALRQSKSGFAASKPNANSRLIFFRQPLFAGLLLLFTITSAGLAVYFLTSTENKEIAVNRDFEENINAPFGKIITKTDEIKPPENSAENGENKQAVVENEAKKTGDDKNIKNNKTSENRQKSDKKPKQKTGKTVGKTIKLNFADASVLRGEGEENKIYALPAENVNLEIRLAENNSAGTYKISLLNGFAKPLIESKKVFSGGKTVKTDIDLTNQSGKAMLCVSFEDEVPDCLTVNVEKP